MAEIYPPGNNRIFYHIRNGCCEGVTVTADLLDPDLANHINIVLTLVEDIPGLFYFDYYFRQGPYVIIFYELKDGEVIKKWSQAYSIRKEPRTGPSPGNQVINVG